jgi:hypothetical protein
MMAADEWFKFMMRDFKTTGPCKAAYNHDHARCHLYHADPKDPTSYYDQRPPVEIDVVTEQWRPLPKTATATARQFHPTTYKLEECRRIAQGQKCTKGRYCSFNHLNHEAQKVQEHLIRLSQELLRTHKLRQEKAQAQAQAKNPQSVPGLLPPQKPTQQPQPQSQAQSPAPASTPAPAPAPAPASAPASGMRRVLYSRV